MTKNGRLSEQDRGAASKRLAVDIGGTFTDAVLDNAGIVTTTKVLTTHSDPAIGFLQGVNQVLAQTELDPREVELIVHGTTLATNALIERKGAKVALLCTEGFRDTIEMAYEHRFDQYDINMVRPKPLVPRQHRYGIPERVSARGEVLLPLDVDEAKRVIRSLKDEQFEAVAIGLIHSYVRPEHEQILRDLVLQEMPGMRVSISSEVCPEIREYDRISTTVANAYVQPKMDDYLQSLKQGLTDAGLQCPLLMMMSSGTVTTLETARKFPIRLVESGPAGGAIMSADIAQSLDKKDILSFDMGGTTAKMCFIDDLEPQLSRSFEVARECRFLKGSGIPIKIPVIEMVEIGAGGGSIGHINKLGVVAVGPESAGSEPGPVCYGRGGTHPTVTDADVILGRIDPKGFARGAFDLQVTDAEESIMRDIGSALNLKLDDAAGAISEMVGENMSNAARIHGAESGKDVSIRAMIAFGGAAPLHAARLAEKLGISEVIIPKSAGVGSAIGFLKARIAYEVVKTLYMLLGDFDSEKINAMYSEMVDEATKTVRLGAPNETLIQSRVAYMRYRGQGHELAINLPNKNLSEGDGFELKSKFEKEYVKQYGRVIPNLDVEVISWSVTIGVERKVEEKIAEKKHRNIPVSVSSHLKVYEPQNGKWFDYARVQREDLQPGSFLSGPALVQEAETTTVVSSNFNLSVSAKGHILLNKKDKS